MLGHAPAHTDDIMIFAFSRGEQINVLQCADWARKCHVLDQANALTFHHVAAGCIVATDLDHSHL